MLRATLAKAENLCYSDSLLKCKARTSFRMANFQAFLLYPRFYNTYTDEKAPKNILMKKSLKDIENETSPVAVILGWGDSKHRHLERYADLLERRGFTSVMVTNSIINAAILPERSKRLAADVMTFIRKQFLNEKTLRPVLFYPFSGGGCSFVLLYLQVYSQRENYVSQQFPYYWNYI